MRISILRKLLAVAVPLTVAGCGGSSFSTDSQTPTVSLALTPELKAAMEFGSATTLEKSRKTKQALSAYRRIIQEYPDSPQAKIAAERLSALGSK
jgi:hypothetical protein